MIKIITDMKKILYETGIDAEKFITSQYMRDSLLGEKPLLIKFDSGKTCFCTANLEKANIEHTNPKNIDAFYYYITYKTFSDTVDGFFDEYDSFIDAVKACIPIDERIAVESDMMVETYLKLADEFVIEMEECVSEDTYYIYEKTYDDIVLKIGRKYKNVADKAINLLSEEKNRALMKPYINNREDNRFEILNDIFDFYDIDNILLSSPLNVQEITGIPFYEAKEKEVYALFQKNKKAIKIIASKPLNNHKLIDTVESISDALGEIREYKKLGVELQYLTIKKYTELNLNDRQCIDMCNIFRECREKMAVIDIAYYIIAAKATMYALDSSINYVRDELSNHNQVTELQAFNKYLEYRDEYIKVNDLPVKMDIYQAVAWCGNRSIYCGYATEFIIDDQCKTFRMDIGDFVMDCEDGFIHATSDSCRTLCLDKNVKHVYDVITGVMKYAIATIKPGIKCSEVWQNCMKPIFEMQESLKNKSIIPKNKKLEDLYKRNVGHAMCKQTRTIRMLSPGSKFELEEGMVGTIEIPFGYNDIAFSVEEMWFVTKSEAINLSVG